MHFAARCMRAESIFSKKATQSVAKMQKRAGRAQLQQGLAMLYWPADFNRVSTFSKQIRSAIN
jgi:hypothetical protein